ncbi:toll/interleukin-1 receptor domain-containing protein [Herbiconiux sp. P17]|uniref:toll/interleukin-1 receptor domain-containing protein n=1 Tax=Herbiconiux wuyangfengii TaxID=3342794 RepID=UPI0035B6E0DF
MTEHDFDVAVTFAGEDREYVEAVVALVKEAGFKVFYDEDYKYESWGEDLTEYFPDVYERRARFAVMFISKDYAAKPWTRLERRSVLVRAMNDRRGYLLPVRLDSTKLPGVRDAIGYLDGANETPIGIARAIVLKLGSPKSEENRLFNGRVPRTDPELAIMLGERPRAWEYLLFAYHLHEKTDALKHDYTDFRLGFAVPRGFLSDENLSETLSREIVMLSAIADMLESLLLGPAQEEAMGAEGSPGDPQLIEALAARITTLTRNSWPGLRSCVHLQLNQTKVARSFEPWPRMRISQSKRCTNS